jgi:DNA-binding PadR family transcriptional regulator
MQSSSILKDLRKRTIKNFLDIFILGQLQENPLSGYDIIGIVHSRFDVLVSSGTIYALLYSLERDGLIKGVQDQRKRVYELTEKGEEAIQVLVQANGEIQNCLKSMLISS